MDIPDGCTLGLVSGLHLSLIMHEQNQSALLYDLTVLRHHHYACCIISCLQPDKACTLCSMYIHYYAIQSTFSMQQGHVSFSAGGLAVTLQTRLCHHAA